jgi:calcineurin-like phosphoesterase family protein
MSDLHLNHDKEFLWGARGFRSNQEHLDFIFDNWSDNIDSDTVVLNLGDSCFGDKDSVVFNRLLRMPYRSMVILGGNHTSGFKRWKQDSCVPSSITVGSHFNVCIKGNDTNANSRGGKMCVINHFPLYIWDSGHHGSYMLSGHSHGSCGYTNPNSPQFGRIGRVMDCGVECALAYYGRERFFFEFADIDSILSSTSIVKSDHHDGSVN